MLLRSAPSPVTIARSDSPASYDIKSSIAKVNQLPPLSDTAVRAAEMSGNANAKLSDFAGLINRDASLAAAILKIANSCLYQGRHPVNTVDQALLRLGIRGCSNILTSIGLKRIFANADVRIKSACEALLRHSFFAATITSGLNREWKLGFGGEEFTAALLHDVGRLIIAVAAPEAFLATDSMSFDEGADTPVEERFRIGTNHCTVGLDFARRSHLPEPILAAIEFHHTPASATVAYRRIVALVNLADCAANYAQRMHKVSDLDLQQVPGYVLLQNGQGRIPANAAERLPNLVVGAMRETRALIKVL